MARGRKRTPTAILKFRGSRSANARRDEPTPEPGIPSMPVPLDGEALRCWNDLAPKLSAMGVLAVIDGIALARYCRLWGRWTEAESFIAEHGMTLVTTKKSGQTTHSLYPQVRQAARLAEELLRLEREFGLTPSSRAGLRVTAREPERDSSKLKYFSGAISHE